MSSFAFSANVYNQDGDFSVEVDSLTDQVFNNNINSDLQFTITNNQRTSQDFELILNKQPGWDIDLSNIYFTLLPGESKELNLSFSANNEFDYTENVVGPDIITISQKSDYVGYFEFPLIIKGENENVSLKYKVNINRPEEKTIVFTPRISTQSLSPISPLGYTITTDNLAVDTKVDIKVSLNGFVLQEFSDTFTASNDYKVYQAQIPSTISPGEYQTSIVVRYAKDGSVEEWSDVKTLEVKPYENLVVFENNKNLWYKDSYSINVTNKGNIQSTFEKSINMSLWKRLLMGSNTDYLLTDSGIKYQVELERGESKLVEYSYNYLVIYTLLLVVLILGVYIYVRKNSNPLDVETKVYEIKKVPHEGVKSLKLRIGFENIKESEIDDLKVVFRMPSYLQVKDNSFLLTEPKHVFKGKNQFKLIWEFKRFEKNDSRIIGFTLINSRGVLGDIKIPDIEFEVKINGKVRRYYKNFPIVKG